ncbi:Wzz/FepE/Etk N-terminal domain-containing protein [Arcobacter defluvii]|uniref:Chain length determinant protein, Wzz family n=1 Tax=Arcobacter defluvii TaxID=873191 RepID=A0AAE7BFI0_9BACT|nr:Wzz/FepE/Etk N-terminal domain-containing protein [Arcobacter defluvii]QKF76859.1 putative chain length determinant protein, Wzz family [Arcobacter defluvii]
MDNKADILEDEIDLKELFKTIWNKRVFILIVTSVITLLTIVYVNIKTPIYEVKALIEIGTYKTETNQNISIDDADILAKKLSTIFIDLRKNINDKEFEITKTIPLKGMKNFIEISSEAKSNTDAINGLNEVIEYIKKDHLLILNDIKEKNEAELKNLELTIKNIKEDKIVNIDKKIELYTQNILNLEEQMKYVTEVLQNITKLDPSISALKLMEKRDISNAIIENKSTLFDLTEQKENLLNVQINKLLERKKLFEALLLPYNLKNSEIVGKILVDDKPIKPKKLLIIVVAFVTGFILAIFAVFFMQFINNMRKEEK